MPGKKRGRWTVIVPGSKAPGVNVPDQAWTFNDRRRADRLAGNIQGSRVSGPRGHVRRGAVGRALLFVVAVGLVVLGLTLIFG